MAQSRPHNNPPQLQPSKADDYALSEMQTPRDMIPTARMNKGEPVKNGQMKPQNTLEDDVTLKEPNQKSMKTVKTLGQEPVSQLASLKVQDRKSVVSNPPEMAKAEQLASNNIRKMN